MLGYLLDTAVFQTPKYLITQVGNKKFLRCEQKLNHNIMYWFKQDSKQPLKTMFVYNNKELILNDTVPSRFSPDPDRARLNLHVSSLEPGDSAMYLCASSQDTALQSHRLPVHKPHGPARKLWAPCSPEPGAPFTPVIPLTGLLVCSIDSQYTRGGNSTFNAQRSLTEFCFSAGAGLSNKFRIPSRKDLVP
ncbi:hypothetical protein MC885_012889 [Smutsia gigantea]|nr:hypothetical protein MC885_012889 [Smutsia gigantea]